jgi:hypothetical protein
MVNGTGSPLLVMGMGAPLGGIPGPNVINAQQTGDVSRGAALTVNVTWMVDDWTVSPVTVGGNTGVTVTVAEYVPAVSPVKFGVRVRVDWDWLS